MSRICWRKGRNLRIARRVCARAVWAMAVLLGAGAAAHAAAPRAIVTAVTGNAGASGVALERQSTLVDGDSLRTGEDGACSILVDGDAVLELCQTTTLRLGHREGRSDGPRVLELRAGEIRVLAEPRSADRRIEIHTPAAIATVLGSVVYVAVDARGVTTIASAESKVRVESSRRLGRAMTLSAGQQITVRPGAPLPRNAEIWDPDTSPADGCLIDFRAIAFDASRDPGDGRALDHVTEQDVIDALPKVSAASEGRWDSPVKDDWIDPKLHRIYDVIDTGAVPPPSR
jgi:ferric-dicitrate binding protein FerR (iron transport regulator)